MISVPKMRDEQRFTDLLRDGKSLSKTTKIKRLVNSLQWRHRFQSSDRYSIKILGDTVITVKQVSNGEIMGLGTGVSVWPAAHVLSKYLEKRYSPASLRNLRVCDIGSGTGCTGFVAAALGAHVTLTDQAQILPFLEGNRASICQANTQILPQQIDICQYDWGASAAHLKPPFDIILVSDCVLPKLYPISPLIEAVAAIMDSHSIALFSYEHRLHPYFDPRQEFRRLASKLGLSVRVIPLSEHDSYYCLDDVEIWEVSFSSLSSEDLEFVEGGGGASKISNNYISCIQPNCKQTNALSRADSPATTDITAASLNTDSSILKDVRKKNVEMLSWGSALVVTARLLDEVVEIRQNFDRGGTGCFLWASSVILSRLILSEEFDQEIMSMFNPTSFIKTKSPFKPTAVDLGAGCGLTTIALLKKGFNVIATDRKIALPLLNSNVQAYLAERNNRKRNNIISPSTNLFFDDDDAHVSESAQVVEFDWQHSFTACASCLSSTSYSDKSVDLLEALQSLSHASHIASLESCDPKNRIAESDVDPGYNTFSYPDLLVCSDCIYASASVKPLLQALSWLAGPNTVLLIGNEMRTALDHFVSEARQLHSGADCASSSPLNSGLSQDNKECHTALRSESSQCELAAIQTFEWSFRDLQIKDLEVFEGDHTDVSAAVETRCSNEELDREAGMEQHQPRSSSSSDSTVNRPVRVIVGRKILQ